MAPEVYTAITFAPVQGFIEKSRKLRDLYGSSFLLSYQARAICDAAISQKYKIVSPALINVIQCTPNRIIIRGETAFPKPAAKAAFDNAWKGVMTACREWIENHVFPEKTYYWKRDWKAWTHHTWEFFWGEGATINQASEAVNEDKRSRDWIGINWVGESSTLSGADAIAWHGLGRDNPQFFDSLDPQQEIAAFYERLSKELGKAFFEINRIKISENDDRIAEYGAVFVDPDEELSIPELVKRLITHQAIAHEITARLKQKADPKIPHRINDLAQELNPHSFRDLSRLKDQDEKSALPEYYTGWFQGDGDRIGQHLQTLDTEQLHQFSQAMIDWGEQELKPQVKAVRGRTIYAGGDDFLGVLYRLPAQNQKTAEFQPLTGQDCLNFFYKFPQIWAKHQQPITVSVGFVWAAPSVPQRDVLQHCRETEQSAKKNGRDRLAVRILFNGGNWREWVCPWWFLNILAGEENSQPNWTHFYADVATLKSRHAFRGQTDVALALFEIYFGKTHRETLWNHQWDIPKKTGILGNRHQNQTEAENIKALNQWIINLAEIGFHLCEQDKLSYAHSNNSH